MNPRADKIRLLVVSYATGVRVRGSTLVYDRLVRRFGGYGDRFDTRLALVPEGSTSRIPSTELPAGITPVWLPAYHSRVEFMKRLPKITRSLWQATEEVDAVLIGIPVLHGLPALLSGKLRRKPVVVLMLASWAEIGRPGKPGWGRSNMVRRFLARLASNLFAGLSTKLLVHGGVNPDLIGPLKRKAIPVFESTLTKEDILPLPPTPRDDLRLLGVGRLVATKRYDVALKTLKILRDRGKAAELTLVGDGPERPALEKLAKRLSIEEFVTWEGFIDDVAALRRQYRSAFALLHPSETEGLSLAITEAMAAGTAVVCTGVGGMQSFLDSGTDSLVVDAADVAGIADAVELLIDEPERCMKMIEAAQKKVRGFTHEAWVEKLDSIVKETLAASASARQ